MDIMRGTRGMKGSKYQGLGFQDASAGLAAPYEGLLSRQDEQDAWGGALKEGVHRTRGMNAFELMAQALDISPIFDAHGSQKAGDTRFVTRREAPFIVATLGKAAEARGGRLVQSSQSRFEPRQLSSRQP